jgi:hypothetical protein
MGARWEDAPRPATEPALLEDVNLWLLVMFLVLFLAPLALGLSR